MAEKKCFSIEMTILVFKFLEKVFSLTLTDDKIY